jgi:hypothetical protein
MEKSNKNQKEKKKEKKSITMILILPPHANNEYGSLPPSSSLLGLNCFRPNSTPSCAHDMGPSSIHHRTRNAGRGPPLSR